MSNVVGILLPYAMPEKKIFTKLCDSLDTFETIVQAPLHSVGTNLRPVQVTEQKDKKLRGGASLVSGEISSSISNSYQTNSHVSPSTVAESLKCIVVCAK